MSQFILRSTLQSIERTLTCIPISAQSSQPAASRRSGGSPVTSPTRTSGQGTPGRSAYGDTSVMQTRLTSSHFVGRSGELAELELAMREACAGRPALVLLGGESGVGKT